MVVKFKPNSFYRAAGNVKPDVKSRIQFSYGAVTRISFNQAYNLANGQNGHVGRKLFALPSAVFSVARMVANVAYIVFVGLPFLLVGNVKPITQGAFRFVRNGEICAGKLLRIFNDRLGQYHVQKGEFNKKCYSLSMHESMRNTSAAERHQNTCNQLIAKFYDKNNPKILLGEFRKVFKSLNDENAAGELLLAHIANQKDNEFIEKLDRYDAVYFNNAKRQLTLAKIYEEKGAFDKAFKAIEDSPMPKSEKYEAFTKLGEKCVEANHLEVAFRICDRVRDFHQASMMPFFTKLVDACLKKNLYAKAMEIAKDNLFLYHLHKQFFIKGAVALIKDPLFNTNQELLSEMCRLEPNLMADVAARLLRSGDESHAKRAIAINFKSLIAEKLQMAPPSEKLKHASTHEKLTDQSFAAIKGLLLFGLIGQAVTLIQNTIEQCNEFSKPQPRPFHFNRANDDFFNDYFKRAHFPFFNNPNFGPNGFFFGANFFGQGANFNRGNPFAGANFNRGNPFAGANFNRGYPFARNEDPNLPKEVAQIKSLSPKNAALVALYQKCREAKPENYHKVFDLNQTFTAAELTKASRKYLLQAHPDKNPEEVDAANEITAVLTCIREALKPFAKG